MKISATDVLDNMVENLRDICDSDGDELARFAELLYINESGDSPVEAFFDAENDEVEMRFGELDEEGEVGLEESEADANLLGNQ